MKSAIDFILICFRFRAFICSCLRFLLLLATQLSSKVLQLGGNSICDECKSNPVFACDDFRVTSGGSSQFDNIVHFVPPKLDLLAKNLESVLVLINDKLQKCSVAIPAIGTGKIDNHCWI